MEPTDAAATQTFRSQTELIMEVAVESAVSVLQQRLGQVGLDSEERRVRKISPDQLHLDDRRFV